MKFGIFVIVVLIALGIFFAGPIAAAGAATFAWALTAFVFGSALFWLAIIALICLETFFIDQDQAPASTITFILIVLFLQFLAGVPVFRTAYDHPIWTGLGIVAYFLAVGPAFLLYKWRSRNKKYRYRYEELLLKFKKQHDLPLDQAIPESKRLDFQTLIGTYQPGWVKSNRIVINPDWRDHKSELFIWWAYWPFSMAWTLLNDPVKRLWREVLQFLSKQLDRITASAWAGTEKDLAPPPDKDFAPPQPKNKFYVE